MRRPKAGATMLLLDAGCICVLLLALLQINGVCGDGNEPYSSSSSPPPAPAADEGVAPKKVIGGVTVVLVVLVVLFPAVFPQYFVTPDELARAQTQSKGVTEEPLEMLGWESLRAGITIAPGTIQGTIVCATGLANADCIGNSDPYAIIKLGEQSVRTKTIANTLNPYWEHEFTFRSDDPDLDVLEVLVYDEDPVGDDELLGKGRLNVTTIRSAKHDKPTTMPLMASKWGAEVDFQFKWIADPNTDGGGAQPREGNPEAGNTSMSIGELPTETLRVCHSKSDLKLDDFDGLVTRLFARYDLDQSGTINSLEELEMVAVNTAYHIGVLGTLEHIIAAVEAPPNGDNQWSEADFSDWFKQKVIEAYASEKSDVPEGEKLSEE